MIAAEVVHGTPGDGFAGSGAELDDEGAGDAGGARRAVPLQSEMSDDEGLPSPSNDGPVTTPATATPAATVVPAA